MFTSYSIVRYDMRAEVFSFRTVIRFYICGKIKKEIGIFRPLLH